MLKRMLVVVTCCAVRAVAQTPEPSVTPFPVEVKRATSGFSKKEIEELQKDFVRLVRKVSLVPDGASYEVALKELKRQDCDREDECLQQLAAKGQTLYAVYASIDYTVSGQVVATGRVVRDDGKLVSGPATITVVKGKDAFRDIAKVALTRLLDELKVAQLSPSRPVVEAAVPKKDPANTRIEPPPGPPPIVMQPLEPKMNPVRVAGWVGAGVGAAVLVTGIAVFAAAPGVRRDANGLVFKEDEAKYATAVSMQSAGVGLMVGGAVVGIAGATLAMISKDSESVRTTVVPMPGGAAFVIGGVF